MLDSIFSYFSHTLQSSKIIAWITLLFVALLILWRIVAFILLPQIWFQLHPFHLHSLGNFNKLFANNALIGTLEANTIKSENRDIGYHIPLKDLSQKGELNEGDVVGFFEDENQKTVIERLNKENYHRAKLAGVITRSYYIEGMCPEALLGMSLVLFFSLSLSPLFLCFSLLSLLFDPLLFPFLYLSTSLVSKTRNLRASAVLFTTLKSFIT